MGQIVYVKDINGNIVETEIRDEREERVKELEEENKNLKELIMATIKMAFERNGYDAMTHLINEGEKLGLIYVRKSGE